MKYIYIYMHISYNMYIYKYVYIYVCTCIFHITYHTHDIHMYPPTHWGHQGVWKSSLLLPKKPALGPKGLAF